MAYALRAFYEQENNFGVTDRVEIYEDGFSGSVIQLGGRRPVFEHEEITGEGTGGILSVHDNKIMMGSLTFEPRIDTSAKKTLIQDISDASPFDFQVRFKRDSDTVWYGYPSGRVFSYPEKESYFARILFKDFEILKSIDYDLTDERQHPIITLAELFDYLSFGINIVTNTSWQEEDTTIADDFLNQIYHDTVGLRQYGDSGDEDDVPISVYDALLIVAEPVLLIKQWDGFRVDQLSAKQSPISTLVSVYNSSGVQQSSTLSDIRQTGYTTVDNGTPSIKVTSENDSYPAVKRARVFYNFRTSESGIQVPSTVTLEESTAETGTITASTGSTVVSGSGTSFLADVNEGDVIWVDQSGELRELGEVASVTDNTNITLTSTANYSVSGVAWHLNARETARYSQDFVSDGTQRIRITGTVRVTGNFGTTSIFGRSRLRSGTYYYNRSTQSWAETEVINKFSTTGTQTEKFGSIGIETTDIPDAADGVLELTLFIAIDNFDTIQNVDITNYEDVTFTIRENTASGNSNGIVHELTQSGGYDTYDFGEDLYGEGVGGALYLPSSYRFGTSDTQLATNWRRRGETPYIGFHRLKLREVLDFQRTRTRKIYADAWGEIEPNSVLVYDSNNYFYVGGVYDGFWRPRYIKVNEQTASDTYVSRLVTGGSGTSGNGSNNPTGGGLTQTVADDLYFRQDENLSEGDPETIRDNIELGEADSPTFDGLKIGGEWLLDTENPSGVNRLSIRAQAGNEDMELFLHPIGSATHARLEVSNDPNLNNYNSIAIESNEVSQRIVSRAQGSAGILPLQIRVAGDETLSLWTNDVQRVSVGSSSATLTVPFSGTSATFTGDIQVNSILFSDQTYAGENSVGNAIYSAQSGTTGLMDLNPPDGGTSGRVRLFRGSTLSGDVRFEVLKGDGTADAMLMMQKGNGLYLFEGNYRVGSTTVISSARLAQNLTGVNPATDNGSDLGTSSLQWRDLHLGRNAYVAGGLFVDEFLVNTTKVFFDHAISQGGGKLSTVTGSAGSEVITFEDADGAEFVPLAVDDIIHIQQRTGVSSGTIVKNIWRKVASIASNDITLTTTGIGWTTGEDVGSIAVGDNVVQKGNTTDADRQSYVEMLIGGLDVPQNKVWSGVDDVGGGSEVIRVWGLDGFGATGDRGIAGKVGGNLAFEVSETRGFMGGLIFDDQELRNVDDTFSFSSAGIKLTSTEGIDSALPEQQIRFNSGAFNIGLDANEGTGYLSALTLNLRSTFGATQITGSDGVNSGNVRVTDDFEINTPDGLFLITELPTTEPGTPYTVWNDNGTLKITDPPTTPPSTPTGLALTRSRANNAMRIVWNGASGADDYQLRRSTDEANWTVVYDNTGTQYFDTTPFSNKSTTYFYQIRATNSGGSSSYSSSVSESWNSASNNEALIPKNVSFIFSGFGSDTLSFNQPDSGAPASYNIQYAIDTGSGFGSWNSLNPAYTGGSPFNFDACSLASNGDDMKLRIAANYSNPTETSSFVESNAEAISGCF